MKPERNVPNEITADHIGTVVIYKLPNQAVLSEGEITAISPGGGFYRIGDKRWLPNTGTATTGHILSILTKPQTKRRACGI